MGSSMSSNTNHFVYLYVCVCVCGSGWKCELCELWEAFKVKCDIVWGFPFGPRAIFTNVWLFWCTKSRRYLYFKKCKYSVYIHTSGFSDDVYSISFVRLSSTSSMYSSTIDTQTERHWREGTLNVYGNRCGTVIHKFRTPTTINELILNIYPQQSIYLYKYIYTFANTPIKGVSKFNFH